MGDIYLFYKIFIGNLSSLSTLNKLVFSFFKKNEEKIKDKNFKTEIEKQNDSIKLFLEAFKNLIDENLEVIKKYIQENKKDSTLELGQLFTIEKIIKTGKNLDIKYVLEIKMFMNEFGFKTFELLIIVNTPKYIGNLIITTLGVLEVCVGSLLLIYSSTNPLTLKIAHYLIREGIKDIIKGVKATVQGEEINLKNYAVEKGSSLLGFALDLALGGAPTDIGNNIKDKIFHLVKDECTNLVKNYANDLIANQIVKKIINKLSEKLKSYLITPLMNNMYFKGDNIDKIIQYDIINNNDKYKEIILDNYDKILEQMDNLIDFLGPIIELRKSLKGKDSSEKLASFLDFLSKFDYQGLNTIKTNICDILKNSKIDVKPNNDLSTLIKSIDTSFTEKSINETCKEFIECGLINKNGELNKDMITIKGFKQKFKIKINDEYLKYEYNNKKNISNELKEKLNKIASKVDEIRINNKKKDIKEKMYNRLENFIQSLIKRVLELLEDKVSDKIEQLWKKYQKKKQIKNGELNDEDDSKDKKKKKKLDEEDEEEEIKIAKKSNFNQINKEEDINLPELNEKAIEKSKKNKQEIIKEKSKLLIHEKNPNLFFKETKKFFLQFGTKEGINNILIPKLINILSDYFKDKLKTKLLPKLLSRFDDNFERFGIHIIFLQKKYNIKGFIDKLLDRIRKAFDIIVDIQLTIIPILRDFQNKIKNGEKVHVIIMNFSNELIT